MLVAARRAARLPPSARARARGLSGVAGGGARWASRAAVGATAGVATCGALALAGHQLLGDPEPPDPGLDVPQRPPPPSRSAVTNSPRGAVPLSRLRTEATAPLPVGLLEVTLRSASGVHGPPAERSSCYALIQMNGKIRRTPAVRIGPGLPPFPSATFDQASRFVITPGSADYVVRIEVFRHPEERGVVVGAHPAAVGHTQRPDELLGAAEVPIKLLASRLVADPEQV